MKKLFFTLVIPILLPLLSFAQTGAPVRGIKSLFVKVLVIVNQAISVLFALAIMFFLWNIVVYLAAGAKSEKRSEAAKYMFYGIIVLFVMVGVYGFINILLESTGLQGGFFLPAFKY